MALAFVNSFWIGPALGPVHAACLRSFVTAGHSVRLFAYESPGDVPSGVEVLPAAEIMPAAEIRQYVDGRHYELLSDLFRYRLLAASAGLWADADCYCLRPIEDDDYIFGQETDETLNTALLKLPVGSPLLDAMLAIGPGFIPPWNAPRRRRLQQLRRQFGMSKPLQRMAWGTIGPVALTYYADQCEVTDLAMPSDVFYPIHWQHLDRLFDSELQLSDLVTRRTRIVHLCSSKLRKQGDTTAPPAGSPLAKLLIGDTGGLTGQRDIGSPPGNAGMPALAVQP